MATGKLTIVVLAVSAVAFSTVVTVTAPSATEETQRALQALAERDAARAESIAIAVVASERENSSRAWLIVATARQRLGRYAQAEEAYRQYLAVCGSAAERAYVMEQIRRCRSATSPPARPAPMSKLLTPERRAKLAEVYPRQHVETTEHFVVRAYNPPLAKLVAAQAELALGRICGSILSGQAYPHSVRIYVWSDIEEYRRHAVSAPEWSGGNFSLRQDENGQLVRRIDLTQLDGRGRFDVVMLDRVLPHEMCHLVLAEFFGEARCPLAVTEGLAMLAEAEVDNSRVLLAGAALAGDKRIPIGKLLIMDRCEPDNASVFYAESFSLVEYLHSRMTGRQFREMLLHVKSGCTLQQALQRALYVPDDVSFLDRLARAWADDAIRQSQFLKALDGGVDPS